MQIIIDPGHGGDRDNGKSTAFGARGPGGTLEKDVTLCLARLVSRRFGCSSHVVGLTRLGDENPTLGARADLARLRDARVFLSLHARRDGAAAERGSETWVHQRAGATSAGLAAALQGSFARFGAPERGVRRGELAVLTPERLGARTAACLVEIDGLGDAAGERRLRDPAALDAIAASIADGVRRWGDGDSDSDSDSGAEGGGEGAYATATAVYSRQNVTNPGDPAWSLVVGPTPNPPRSAGSIRRGTIYSDYSGWQTRGAMRMKVEIPSRGFDADLIYGWDSNGELPSLPGVGYVKNAWVDAEARSIGAGGVSFGVLALAKWDSEFEKAKVQLDINIDIDSRSGSRATTVKRVLHLYGDGDSREDHSEPLPR